jgi:hypothetical protein
VLALISCFHGQREMPKKRSVDEVLAEDAVSNVHPETVRERVFRLLIAEIERIAALTIVVIGLVGTLAIMALNEKLQANAFQLFSAIVTGGLGYFFGTRTRK